MGEGKVLPDDIITVRTAGLSAKQVIDRLGGMGRDKPVRAVYIGADMFAAVDRAGKLIEAALADGIDVDADELLEALDPCQKETP